MNRLAEGFVFLGRIVFLAAGLALLASCGEQEPVSTKHAQSDSEYERGPHEGRLLRSGKFAIEMTIFEEGTEPEFHVYGFWDGKPVEPGQVQLAVKLSRLGGGVDDFAFDPKDDYLLSRGKVHEPHSFDVSVNARFQNREYVWTYASYEGRTTITAEAAAVAGMKVETAGSATIDETIDLPGRIVLQPQGRAEVRAWFPGRIKEMMKAPGQTVQKGEILLQVEASDSLRTYQIASPIGGVIVERNANIGDLASSQIIYTIADNTLLQAVFYAFPRDAERLRNEQDVSIRSLVGQSAQSKIKTLLPSTDSNNQTMSVYAELSNGEGQWRPGMAVEGFVTVASTPVALAVRTQALQRFRNFIVVFIQEGDTYEVRMLKIGRQTPAWTEVLGGLKAGDRYVTENAFLIRADIEKKGASHDH